MQEEIVSSLKNCVIASRDIQAWSFGRLEQVFQCSGAMVEGPVILLRRSSWEELQRFFSQEIGKFILPTTTGIVGYENEGDENSTDEYDGEGSNLLRFHFSSLDAFHQQNASLDGAASTGLLFQKLLSCLIRFEKGVSLSKISSDGFPIESVSVNNSDIKQWLVDLVSNEKYFFHWICQNSDELLNQSALGRECEKTTWWKLVARAYIGCGICNIILDMLMWKWSAGNANERDVVNEDLTVLHTDDCKISVWSLMEVEFSLQRMIQKLATHNAYEKELKLSKEYVRSVSYGLHRVLQPAKLNILTAIKCTLQASGASKAVDYKRPNRMSFDAVLFALDSCCSTLEDEGLFGVFFPSKNGADGLIEASIILEVLLRVYINVRNRIVSGSTFSDADDVRLEGGKKDEFACRQQFSLYADSISAKFPASARHLVLPGKNAKSVVLLDTKGGEEMLEHVCAAIGRTLETMIESTTDLHSVHNKLGQTLSKVLWTGSREQSEILEVGYRNNFACLSGNFLGDAKECIQLNGLTKLAVSCVSLSKRLLDNAADMVHIDCSMDSSDSYKLSSLAYDILCDNVVYNARLLRPLMNICLPTYLALRIKTFVTLESKIEGIIQKCLIDLAEDVNASANTNHQRRPALTFLKQKIDTPARRVRLRQSFDVRSSYHLRRDSGSDSNTSSSSESNVSDYPNAVIDSHTNGIRRDHNQDRIPHLHSHATQSIAIITVLALLEKSQSTLLNAITAKNGGSEPCSFPHYQEILCYNRIHEHVNIFIRDCRDFLWETRNVLLKILHMIELGLRIGKAIGSFQRKGDDPEVGMWHDSTISIYESSVTSALSNRAWVCAIKDASQDSGTKTKVTPILLAFLFIELLVPTHQPHGIWA